MGPRFLQARGGQNSSRPINAPGAVNLTIPPTTGRPTFAQVLMERASAICAGRWTIVEGKKPVPGFLPAATELLARCASIEGLVYRSNIAERILSSGHLSLGGFAVGELCEAVANCNRHPPVNYAPAGAIQAYDVALLFRILACSYRLTFSQEVGLSLAEKSRVADLAAEVSTILDPQTSREIVERNIVKLGLYFADGLVGYTAPVGMKRRPDGSVEVANLMLFLERGLIEIARE